jgi:type IV pilus biogenesis protein CpaD/CtpE
MKMYKIILALSAVVMLSGCTSLVTSDTWVNKSGRAQIAEDQFTDTFETAKVNNGMIHAISNYYDRFGNGTMNVVVSYDPQSKINSLPRAEKSLVAIQNGLARNGIADVKGALSEVRGSGDVSTTLVSFPALTASAPAGCGMMPGYADPSEGIPNDTNIKGPYGYGCTVETLLSKQIARPSDLMGRAGFETNGDGRRAERVLSSRGYYSDKENTQLQGETASGSQ